MQETNYNPVVLDDIQDVGDNRIFKHRQKITGILEANAEERKLDPRRVVGNTQAGFRKIGRIPILVIAQLQKEQPWVLADPKLRKQWLKDHPQYLTTRERI